MTTKREKNTLYHNLANKHCPFCGWEVSTDEMDFCYPTNQTFTVWNACCSNWNCGATTLGGTQEEAINNWNKRYEINKQN